MTAKDVRGLLRVPARGRFRIADFDASATHGAKKRTAENDRERDLATLRDLQQRLYAEQKRSLLLVLQGMDTAGKDGVISHVISGLNPQGVSITAFRAPTAEEKRHDFLWRIRRALPRPGQIGIFNRSQYEDVLIVRVLDLVPRSVWSKRYATINAFEREVARRGTTIVKCCLVVSLDEQRRRLLDRLETPEKRWKFNPQDLAARAHWPDYQDAYDAALSRCNTDVAPWYVIPSDKEWYRNWAVARILIETLRGMDPQYPTFHGDMKALERQLRRGA